MDLQTALKTFIEELARRDGSRAVAESTLRSAIRGYVRCRAIAHHSRPELTAAQLDRAVALYARRRAELHKQPLLLAA